MNKLLLLAPTALSLFCLTGCRKDSDVTGPMAGPYFPNAVGNEWHYAVYDSLSRQASALTVRVVGTAALSDGQPATVWRYTFTTRIDTQYVTIRGDTVRAYAGRDARRSQRVVWAILPLRWEQSGGRPCAGKRVRWSVKGRSRPRPARFCKP